MNLAQARPAQAVGEPDHRDEWQAALAALRRRWWQLLLAAFVGGAVTAGGTYLVAPVYTAVTTLLPPQQPQSSTAAALASLSSLAGIGGGGAARTTGDQYVSLLQSVTVTDRLVDQFGLMAAYEEKFKVDARRRLQDGVRISAGKKDGLLTIEVEDTDPKRAAAIANQYVEELRRMVAQFAVTEAQQRRIFFEAQMKASRDRLSQAQLALQSSGFNLGALKAEPRAAAENYSRLRAELTAAEVRLQSLRTALLDTAPEIRSQEAAIATLRAQITQLERSDGTGGQSDFVSRYRDYKYQEALFDVMARQYELARVDESRDGGLIQVLDPASVPEKRSRPRRTQAALLGALGTMLFLLAWIVVRATLARPAASDPPAPAA